MAACSKFFKDQLCKVNVQVKKDLMIYVLLAISFDHNMASGSHAQVPVILRLEDFGLELKRDAVSYIIEFVYRGEVNIPGERLTDVCQVKL